MTAAASSAVDHRTSGDRAVRWDYPLGPVNVVRRCRGIAGHATLMPNDDTQMYPSLGIGEGRRSWVSKVRAQVLAHR